jgi:hypothetical protein
MQLNLTLSSTQGKRAKLFDCHPEQGEGAKVLVLHFRPAAEEF